MEQLSFNQNLTYAPARAAVNACAGEARVIGSVNLGSSMTGMPADRYQRPVRESSGRETGNPAGNVTEIILPASQVENFQLLLPMLTQLNQERRWLAWIDPPQELLSKWQNVRGIITGEILVLRSSGDYSALALAEKALGAGTCHAVVMWTGKLGRRAFESLQKASAAGNSHGVVLRQR